MNDEVKQMAKEKIKEFDRLKPFLPFAYKAEVREELVKMGYPGDYRAASLTSVRRGERVNAVLLDALIAVAKKHHAKWNVKK